MQGRKLASALIVLLAAARAAPASAQTEAPLEDAPTPPDLAEPMLAEETPAEQPRVDVEMQQEQETVAELIEEHVAVHGFGFWGGGVTSGNQYLFGTEDVSLGHAAFAPRILATFGPELKMATGFELLMEGSEFEIQLDFAYVEWRPVDRFALMVGRTIFPHGFYTPIFDVATLRPFGALPQAIYGPSDTLAEGLNGVILEFDSANPGGFNVRIDGWVGQVDLEADDTPLLVYEALGLPQANRPDVFADAEGPVLENMRIGGGGVVTLSPRIIGLEIEIGAYGGQILIEPDDLGESDERERQFVALGGINYLGDKLDFHAEYAFHREADELNSNAAYVEGAYRFTEHWQGALRGEYFHAYYGGIDEDALAPGFNDHQSVAVGMNYWQSRDFVLKVSYQYVNGNRFAFPSFGNELVQAVIANDFDRVTHYGEISAGFSF